MASPTASRSLPWPRVRRVRISQTEQQWKDMKRYESDMNKVKKCERSELSNNLFKVFSCFLMFSLFILILIHFDPLIHATEIIMKYLRISEISSHCSHCRCTPARLPSEAKSRSKLLRKRVTSTGESASTFMVSPKLDVVTDWLSTTSEALVAFLMSDSGTDSVSTSSTFSGCISASSLCSIATSFAILSCESQEHGCSKSQPRAQPCKQTPEQAQCPRTSRTDLWSVFQNPAFLRKDAGSREFEPTWNSFGEFQIQLIKTNPTLCKPCQTTRRKICSTKDFCATASFFRCGPYHPTLTVCTSLWGSAAADFQGLAPNGCNLGWCIPHSHWIHWNIFQDSVTVWLSMFLCFCVSVQPRYFEPLSEDRQPRAEHGCHARMLQVGTVKLNPHSGLKHQSELKWT